MLILVCFLWCITTGSSWDKCLPFTNIISAQENYELNKWNQSWIRLLVVVFLWAIISFSFKKFPGKFPDYIFFLRQWFRDMCSERCVIGQLGVLNQLGDLRWVIPDCNIFLFIFLSDLSGRNNMLMILLSTLNVIIHLICGNN